MERYTDFKNELAHSYDKESNDHEAVLRDLFELVFEDSVKQAADDKQRTAAWQGLGF